MKIGIVTKKYEIGGAEISTQERIRELKATGNEVIIIKPSIWDILKYEDDVDYLEIQNHQGFIPILLSGTQTRTCAILRDYTSYCDSGTCSLNRKYKKCGFWNYVKCKNNWDGSVLSIPYKYIRLKLKQYALRRMYFVSSVSKFVKKVYEQIDIHSVVVHTPSVNLKKATKKERECQKERFGCGLPTIGYMSGKLSEGKGIYTFMDAIDRLEMRVCVLICGEPNSIKMQSEFEDWFSMSEQGLSFFGKVDHDIVIDMMKACDVYVHCPTYPDPLPRCVKEAKALGIPVVATNVGGIPEIVDDCDILVEPNDSEGLARAIMEAIKWE